MTTTRRSTRQSSKGEKKDKKGLTIEKIDKPTVTKRENKERYFIVDFSARWTVDGKVSGLSDSVKVGPVATFPNKNAILDQVPEVFGINAIEGVSDIQIFNIRPWELSKEDYEDFTA